MSAEQRGPTPTRSADGRTRLPRSHAIPASNDSTTDPLGRLDVTPERRALPLSYRIERLQLLARIAALERAVETSENRRQAVIDRYERLLADRDETTESAATTETASRTLLARLID
ncbi:hypothetical protein [Natrinema salsiterrestre]|uniref:Uncharacterized protein n=1 Tax=Natrinema salsiterrestre TaxID=2950540 RepID=A0A9Q4Q2I3_9EURY|nr:hypothetical protein [Natrinema salsiterrestre]MDF9748349.1 hypothetical protein [Natrinema salsiterrestre]